MTELRDLRITTPIYRELGGLGSLTTHGTGVFLYTHDCYWLVTAAHVLRDKGPFWIPGRPFHRLESTYRFNERLDVAYLALPKSALDSIASQRGSAGVSDTLIDLRTDGLGRRECQILGYPERTIDLDGANRVITAAQMVMTTELMPHDKLRMMRLDPAVHLAAKADMLRGPSGEKLNGMSFKGLSGGAFWCAIDGVAQLIGIATDHDPKRRIIIGTRTWPILESISAAQRP
jgi:hypothetical protein